MPKAIKYAIYIAFAAPFLYTFILILMMLLYMSFGIFSFSLSVASDLSFMLIAIPFFIMIISSIFSFFKVNLKLTLINILNFAAVIVILIIPTFTDNVRIEITKTNMCVNRIISISEKIEEFKTRNGKLPEKLLDLSHIENQYLFSEPFSRRKFIYKKLENGRFVVSCPKPEAYIRGFIRFRDISFDSEKGLITKPRIPRRDYERK